MIVVVKVGGSLYDLPDLGDRLRCFLASLDEPRWLLVPGGGAAADVVRDWDRDHRLGPDRAHWLALRACSLNAHFLHALLSPEFDLVEDPAAPWGERGILDPFAFAQLDEGLPGCLPHSWDATSDAFAARAAIVSSASLVLLKSVSLPPGVTWEEAARAGLVDPVLPGLIRSSGLRARVVALRGQVTAAKREDARG